jgi:hypothetical protein
VPITYAIDVDRGLIRTKCIGDVAFDEVVDHFSRLEADPAVPERLDVLLDLVGMASIPETSQLKVVAGRVGQLLTKVEWGACAIVAQRDVLFGVSRMFEVFSQNSFSATKVFRALDEAEAWLASARKPDLY